MVDFGSNLKELRLQAGMTQKDLAAKIGVTKSVVSYYELSERSPSPEILIKLANVFHVSADYLLGLDTKSKPMLDISGLDEEDIALLRHVADTLRRKNKTWISLSIILEMQDENKKVIRNESTGQNLRQNILCKASDSETLKIYYY